MKPACSHIGQTMGSVNRPPCFMLIGIALIVSGFTAKGSSSSPAAGLAGFPTPVGRGPVAAAGDAGLTPGDGFGPAAPGVMGRAAGLGWTATRTSPGFPFMGVPQNGQSSASSSRTDCFNPGHVGNAINNSQIDSH